MRCIVPRIVVWLGVVDIIADCKKGSDHEKDPEFWHCHMHRPHLFSSSRICLESTPSPHSVLQIMPLTRLTLTVVSFMVPNFWIGGYARTIDLAVQYSCIVFKLETNTKYRFFF